MNARAMLQEHAHQFNTGLRAFDGMHEWRATSTVACVDVNYFTGRTRPQEVADALEVAAPNQEMEFELPRHNKQYEAAMQAGRRYCVLTNASVGD